SFWAGDAEGPSERRAGRGKTGGNVAWPAASQDSPIAVGPGGPSDGASSLPTPRAAGSPGVRGIQDGQAGNGDRRPPGALPRSDQAPMGGAGHKLRDGLGDHFRNRIGHEPVPGRSATGQLGRAVPRQLGKRGQTAEWANTKREPLATPPLVPVRLGRV